MSFLNFCGMICERRNAQSPQSSSIQDAYSDLRSSQMNRRLGNSKNGQAYRQLKQKENCKRTSLCGFGKSNRGSLNFESQIKSPTRETPSQKIICHRPPTFYQHSLSIIPQNRSSQPIIQMSHRPKQSTIPYHHQKPHIMIQRAPIQPEKMSNLSNTRTTFMPKPVLLSSDEPKENEGDFLKPESSANDGNPPGLSRKTLSDFECIKTESVGGSQDENSEVFSEVEQHKKPMILSHLIQSPRKSPRVRPRKKTNNLP